MYKIIKKLLCLSFVIILNINAQDDSTKDLEAYVKQMVVDSMGIRDSVNVKDKVGRAKTSLLANMDFDSMAKQALGRANYNKMSDKEFAEYKKDYVTYFINVYTKNIDKYNEHNIQILSIVQNAPNQYLVKTRIVNNQSINIDFYIKSVQVDGKVAFKVLDIVTEGISLIQTQNNDFNGIVESKGVDGLIKMLVEKSK